MAASQKPRLPPDKAILSVNLILRNSPDDDHRALQAATRRRHRLDSALLRRESPGTGDLPAGLLLNFILEEIGPVVYNKAIADAQTRLLQRVSDLNGELYADEFQYWPRADAKRKSKR